MRFKVFHIAGKPINVQDRRRYIEDWNKEIDAVELEFGKPETYVGKSPNELRPIYERLDNKEYELKKKYSNTATWTVHNLEQLWDIVGKFGTISICKEGNQKIIYITDMPTTEGLVKELRSSLEATAIKAKVEMPAEQTKQAEE